MWERAEAEGDLVSQASGLQVSDSNSGVFSIYLDQVLLHIILAAELHAELHTFTSLLTEIESGRRGEMIS